MNGLLILGNQLFSPTILKKHFPDKNNVIVYMREDFELCTYFKFHKHKIIFFLAAMRTYADELRKAGFHVHYEELTKSKKNYETHLLNFLKTNKIKKIYNFEIEDKFFEKRIASIFQVNNIPFIVLPSPLFLSPRQDFESYLKTTKKPFMKTFYERQRKTLNILVDKNKKPIGNKWSFDEENRLSLPAKIIPPYPFKPSSSVYVDSIKIICDKEFKDHPGTSENFWLPVSRKGAEKWLDQFLNERFEQFGPYEDALAPHSDFVFHSVITPFLNTGLLAPDEVVRKTLAIAQEHKMPIQSVEGFIRQIIGWREFVRGIYQNFSDHQESSNFWNHQKKLNQHWYDGTTGVPPLDQTLNKVIKLSYAHHIERLMVVGSLMLLLEIHPKNAHRWFMEMFVDSSDWVMGPNVYGMALFSDGGVFATKPYICGSNYYRKMGGYKQDDWCDGVDGLYWQFIEKHKTFFLKNPRLSMMARTVEKMDPVRKKKIFAAAQELRNKLTK